MRPEVLATPKSRSIRIKKWAMAKVMGLQKVPEPMALFLARPKFIKASSGLMNHMSKTKCYWSVGARELMATHVAARFQCPF